MKKLMLATILVVCGSLHAQVVPNFDWIRNYSDQDSLENVPTAIDGSSNIIVCGYTLVGTNDNILVLKYDSLGTLLWTYQYDNGGNDKASSVITDASGNIYLTGASQGTGTANDYITIKLNAAGTQQWASRYNGPTNQADGALAIGIDVSGNVYVTGGSKSSTGFDYATVKYNSAGTQQWAYRYNGTGSGDDIANVLKLDALGNLYITGKAKTATGLDIVTIKINPSTGANIWTHTSNGSANLNDQPFDMLMDGSNPVVAGVLNNTTTGEDYFVRKINGSTGATVWTYNHDCYGQSDLASSLDTTTDGYFIVTGIGKTSGSAIEYHTIKLDNSGSQQWINIEPTGMSGTADGNPKIARDFLDHMYITGQKMGASKDMYVYQLTPGGNKTWSKTHDGFAGSTDIGVSFLVNWIGQLYLVGQTYNLGAKWDFTTIKISQTPVAFPPDLAGENNDPRNLFYENKGQLINTDLDPIDNIKYYSLNNYPHLFWTEDTLSFVFAQLDTNTTDDDTLHRIDLVHLNSNPLTEVYSFEQGQGLLNYYRPHIPSGVTDVRGFQRLMIPNIYNMIDLHYYTNNGGIKYYYVIKPFGGNPSAITQYFDGADTSYVNGSGQLEVVSILDTLVLSQPEAYQVIDTALTMIDLGPAPYIHTGFNTFALDTSLLDTNYIDTLPLIIVINQPLRSVGSPVTGTNVCWSTYYGGASEDKGFALSVGSDGFQQIAGQTASIDFPTTPGAFSEVNPSTSIGFIALFNTDHGRVWSTYFGGNGDTRFFDIKGKNSSQIVAVGTLHGGDLPDLNLTGAYYDATATSTGDDGIIVMFDDLGHRNWATYFCGTGWDDAAFGVDFDASGNMFVVGYDGASDHPLNNTGTYYMGDNSSYNGYIAKFNNSFALGWSTYYGGTGTERISDLAIDDNNNVYVTGLTRSSDLPTYATGSAHLENTFGGGTDDAFIAKFSNTGTRLWATYIGGSSQDYFYYLFRYSDNILDVSDDYVYLTGSTSSTDFPLMSPSSGGYFNNAATGYYDGFLMKFNVSTNALVWSTLLTADGGNRMSAITVDDEEYVFIGGSTADYSFPIVNRSGNYNQSVINSTSTTTGAIADDNVILCFDPSEQMVWSTYFGALAPGEEVIRDMVLTSDNNLFFSTDAEGDYPSGSGTGNYPLMDPSGTDDYFDGTFNGPTDDIGLTFMCLDNFLGIRENIAMQNNFMLYPNPAHGYFTVETEDYRGQKLILSDVLGNQCGAYALGSQRMVLNVSTLPTGVYFVHLVDNTGTLYKAKKLVIE